MDGCAIRASLIRPHVSGWGQSSSSTFSYGSASSRSASSVKFPESLNSSGYLSVLLFTSVEHIMAVASGAVSYLCANVVLQFLAVVGVILRVVARRKKRQPLKADDWTIFVSLVR